MINMNVNSYDIIIIGGGLAGLYYAKRALERNKSLTILVLEANGHLGGRTRMEKFQGVLVPTGAGIGRFTKDITLMQLLTDYKVQHQMLPGSPTNYMVKPGHADVESVYKELLANRKLAKPGLNFKVFATRVLGRDRYNNFADSTGYTDYEQADAKDALLHYGFDDVFAKGFAKFRFSWNGITNAVSRHLRSQGVKIMYREHVTTIDPGADGFGLSVRTSRNRYTARQRVIVATSAPVAKKIMSKPLQASMNNALSYIGTNSFSLMYVKVDKSRSLQFLKNLTGYTVVSGPLQKIIPIDIEQGVYLIGYSDNGAVVELRSSSLGHKDVESLVLAATGYQIKVLCLRKYFWQHGTHFYRPGFSSKYPVSSTYPIDFVGEAYGPDQGWTEGALKSVDRLFK